MKKVVVGGAWALLLWATMAHAAPGIRWETSYADAVKRAKREKKLLMAVFVTAA